VKTIKKNKNKISDQKASNTIKQIGTVVKPTTMKSEMGLHLASLSNGPKQYAEVRV
jgi:hypothetical protein